MLEIKETPYCYEESQQSGFQELADRVQHLRDSGELSPDSLYRIRRFFRMKNIYHSNAIEGNLLDVGETRQVVEHGLTLAGKPLKDQAEARNLSDAIDFLEDLAAGDSPITEHDLRQIHHLVLKGINDEEAGSYRKVPVEISGSDYTPPRPESIPIEMAALSSWLADVSIAGDDYATLKGLLVAAAAHTWFVTTHPFIDGNGRVARLLMNLLLMRYGFPIGIITKEDRLRYYDALEESQASDLTAFLILLAECIHESLEEYEKAAAEQQEQTEWAASLAQKFTEPERVHAYNAYEIWRDAMNVLKSYFRQTATTLNEQADFGKIYFKDFGQLEFEKYAMLCAGKSAKKPGFSGLISYGGIAPPAIFCSLAMAAIT